MTFVPFSSFARCARVLDRRRLGKQRVEAFQIWTILNSVRLGAEALGLPVFPPVKDDETLEDRRYRFAWYDSTVKILRASPERWVARLPPGRTSLPSSLGVLFPPTNLRMSSVPRGTSLLRFRAEDISCFDDRHVTLRTGRVVPRSATFLAPDEYFINLGFASHSVIRYWLGYEDSLADYINAMVDEWIRRGYSSNFPFLMTPPNSPVPPIFRSGEDNSVRLSHRASLLRKELAGFEPPHYLRIASFTSLPFEVLSRGYGWYRPDGTLYFAPPTVPLSIHFKRIVRVA